MAFGFLDVAVTPAVHKVQEELGVAHIWENFNGDRKFDRFTENEAIFISGRDSFYIATSSETGWPYVQHRGGSKGFLKVLNDQTLAFADYRGNKQYISVGNLSVNSKVCLFLMDYHHRTRLKIYAYAQAVSLDANLELAKIVLEGINGKPERIIRLDLKAFDWNCPQHIVPRFTQGEIEKTLRPMHICLERLAAENAELRISIDQRK
ncbi:pyridoxamine 5-phosphate oxidase [Paracoccus liaowanqingii]|uniref:Pyridoxamine 5-phosphate oxidase n=1 Tax=Paracoccus liaowanqingii TaxID=2560053 RepID=A0A4Z1CB57_9RHOB|nr:pyridoxamine 5'-phosphate oxidase family protein [Paracoccus liaowanqingii]TGN61754.1 pyridoxamine 5-phosphate oxidase [Paracoccus liaowanqingii]